MHIFGSVAKELAAGRDELEEKRSGSSGIHRLTYSYLVTLPFSQGANSSSFFPLFAKEGNALQGRFHFNFFYCLRSSSVKLKKSVCECGLDKFGYKIEERADMRNPAFVCFLV